MTKDQEAFEEALTREGLPVNLSKIGKASQRAGEYADTIVQTCWNVWQLALAYSHKRDHTDERGMMTLIQALVMAHQEFGIYGDWKAHHMGGALFIGRGPQGDMYYADDGGVGVFAQSERLEAVLAALAERYPYEAQDSQWKISRW